jgi:hypothetical protein
LKNLTDDESWFHRSHPKIKQQKEGRHRTVPPKNNKPRIMFSIGKITRAVFCDPKGYVLIYFLLRIEVVDADLCADAPGTASSLLSLLISLLPVSSIKAPYRVLFHVFINGICENI